MHTYCNRLGVALWGLRGTPQVHQHTRTDEKNTQRKDGKVSQDELRTELIRLINKEMGSRGDTSTDSSQTGKSRTGSSGASESGSSSSSSSSATEDITTKHKGKSSTKGGAGSSKTKSGEGENMSASERKKEDDIRKAEESEREARYAQVKDQLATKVETVTNALAVSGGLTSKEFFDRQGDVADTVRVLTQEARSRLDAIDKDIEQRRESRERDREHARKLARERSKVHAEQAAKTTKRLAHQNAEDLAQSKAAMKEDMDAQRAEAAAQKERGGEFHAADKDKSGAVTLPEIAPLIKEGALQSVDAARAAAGIKEDETAAEHKIVEQCIDHSVLELARRVLKDLEQNGIEGLQESEFRSVKSVMLISKVSKALAKSCVRLEWRGLMHMFRVYDTDRDGLISHTDLDKTWASMLDFAKHYYGSSFDAFANCMQPRLGHLSEKVLASAAPASGVTVHAFLKEPHEILGAASHLAEFCQQDISRMAGAASAGAPGAIAVERDEAFALHLWALTKHGKGKMAKSDVRKILTDMIAHADRYSSIDDYAKIARCIEDKQLPRAVDDIVNHLSKHAGDGSVAWKDFAKMPSMLIARAEAMVEACKKPFGDSSSTSGSSGSENESNDSTDINVESDERFREQLPAHDRPPVNFGQFFSGFVVPHGDVLVAGGRKKPSPPAGPPVDAFERPQEAAAQVSNAVTAFLSLGKEEVVNDPNEKIGVLGDRVRIALKDSGSESIVQALKMSLDDNLKHNVNRTASRKLTRKLTTTLTRTLTDSISALILKKASDPYVEMATRILVHTLTPTLTHSLSATVTHAMSRHPQEDYFCYFCLHRELYCEFCQDAATNDHWSDYYTNHFAQFYASYYEKWMTIEADLWKVMIPGVPFKTTEPDYTKMGAGSGRDPGEAEAVDDGDGDGEFF